MSNTRQELRWKWICFKHDIEHRVDMFYLWLARHSPRRLVMWYFIHVFAHGTTGDFGNTDASAIPAMEILKRWDTAK